MPERDLDRDEGSGGGPTRPSAWGAALASRKRLRLPG